MSDLGFRIANCQFEIRNPQSAIRNSQLDGMRLIVGLGNPGAEYEWSRHNLGFMVIDRLAVESGIKVNRRECHSLVGRGELENAEVKLIKPQTYMNLSGEAVACVCSKHKLENPGENLVVISDDLALPFGKIRIRVRGSAGGHNGLKSIISVLGTGEFVRLRMGIMPEHPIANARRFVLEAFSRSDREEVEKVLQRSVDAIRTIVREGTLKAMSEYN